MKYIITSIISYLFGSINTAYIISRTQGFDIRERGSHNPGASNMKLTFGWPAAIFTGLCDMLKAILAIKLCSMLFKGDEVIPHLAGAMAVIGHIYPFYMGFKGGKGYASYVGMMIALNFKVALVVMAVTVIVTMASNYIAIGTYAALLIAPIYYIWTKASLPVTCIIVAISAFIGIKHLHNIKKIMNHEEIGLWDKDNGKNAQ